MDHIQCTIHYRLVDQSPSEKAIYLELLQHLAATDFMIVRTNPNEGDRVKQIHDVASGFGDGKPALFMRASHFTFDNDEKGTEEDNLSGLCMAIMKAREKELDDSLKYFKEQLKRTYWLHKRVNSDKKVEGEPYDHFTGFQNRINNNHLGDLPTTETISKAIDTAMMSYRADDWRKYYRPAKTKITGRDTNPLPEYPTGWNTSHGVNNVPSMVFELRTWVSKISRQAILIARQKRSLRFIQNVRRVQCGETLTCSHCGDANLQPSDVKVMAQCGHLLAICCCSGNDCPVRGCAAFNREYQKLAGSDLGQAKFDTCSSHGSKMDAVIELIQDIIEHKHEKVLVFVQHMQSTTKLENALEGADIVFKNLRNETTSSEDLNSFQTGKASRNGMTPNVLILNIGDANASGR